MLAGRLRWPALKCLFQDSKSRSALTNGGRKYVSRFDDEASSTYTEYLFTVSYSTEKCLATGTDMNKYSSRA
jgi:hypothetical protein